MNYEFSEESLRIINKISEIENIKIEPFLTFLKDYHLRIKKTIKYYKTKDGLSDYKLKSHDFLILLCLCMNTKPFEDKIELLLVFMYSYYKLDDIHFSTLDFQVQNLFNFIDENDCLHGLIYKLVTDVEFLKKIKQGF